MCYNARRMDIATLNNRRRNLLVLLIWCLFLMLAWALWLWQLDTSDLTFDETATFAVAFRPLIDIVQYLRVAVREHPPVYYMLIHVWMALAGAEEFSMRLFSVCAGLVALALTGWVARQALARPTRPADRSLVAIAPGALLAVVPGMAYYARDARMYSLGVVWTLLSTGLFLRDWLLAGKGEPRGAFPGLTALIGLGIVHSLALFTHYYLLLPILVQPLVLLLTRRWRPLLAWCVLHVPPALAGLAWLRLAPGLRMTAGDLLQRLHIGIPTRFQVSHLLGKILFSPVLQVRFSLLYWLLALIGVGILLALWRHRPVGIWLALATTAPLALAYSLPNPPAPRYLVFLTPFVALALSHVCTVPLQLVQRPRNGRWRGLAWGATLGLTLVGARMLIAGGLHQAITFDRSHYGHTLQTVKANIRPGDGMLFYGPWQWIPFQYYSPGGLPDIYTVPSKAPPLLKPNKALWVLRKLLRDYDRLWVVPAAVDAVDPRHFAEGWLRTNAHLVWRTNDFSFYVTPLPRGAPRQKVGVSFDRALRLKRVSYEPQPVPASEPLRLTLYWLPQHRLENDVRLALFLVDEEERVWNVAYAIPREWADPPSDWQPGKTVKDYEGLIVPQGAPPGEYVVRLMVSDAVTGEPLLARPSPKAPKEKEIDILTIQVAEPVYDPVLYDLPHLHAATFCPPEGVPQQTCLELVGYEEGELLFRQGYPVPLALHWLVPLDVSADTDADEPLPEVQLRLQVSHRPWLPFAQATPIVTRTLPLALDRSNAAAPPPADAMPSERLLTVPAVLMLPPDASPGPARVTLEVLGPDGSPWLPSEGGPSYTLFDITIEGRPVLRRLPAGLTLIQVDFGEVELRGYRVEGEPRPGGELTLTYAWHAKTRPTAIYAVFNHLLTADGALAAQADGWPQEGRMLTTQWQKGEYIEDSYTLVIPLDAPPGPYQLTVGVYDAATTERQPAFQGGERLPEDRVSIPLPGEDER
jgi:4-amino-4-deoxy-L-arabinose transferase-like glycosyltransferase